MKKSTFLMVALAVALVFAFAATAHATSAKTWNYQVDYYSWGTEFGASDGTGALLSSIGDNPDLPGVHGNYTANTAKCGICHSVHRAAGDGVKLLATADATCEGCHRAGATTVTEVVVTWGVGEGTRIGPHGSSDTGGCLGRSCHMDNPHGANGSEYVIVAAKLLSPNTDAALAVAVDAPGSGITTADVMATGGTWDEATRSAVRTGYNCNQAGCHIQTLLAVVEEGWSEDRKFSYNLDTADGWVDSYGGEVSKTGHLSVAAANGETAFAPVSSCISCHDQTDAATGGNPYSTISGYTFPHGQIAYGASNVPTGGTTSPVDASNPLENSRAWLWMTTAGNAEDDDFGYFDVAADKAKDGACLKCHRSGTSGIGLTR